MIWPLPIISRCSTVFRLPRVIQHFPLLFDRFDLDLLLPPRERERLLERERDRVLPPLEHDLFFDRDLDRPLPERDRFFEPVRDFDLDFERDLEQLLALAAAAARPFLALQYSLTWTMFFGQELQSLLAFPALLLRLLLL